MLKRWAALCAAVLTAITGVIVGAAGGPLPAGAAVTPETITMVPGSGELLIKDAEEPFLLESPTAISGTYDDITGIIAGGTLTTPETSFEVPVLGGALTAEVDATFTQVGTTTGLVGPFEEAVPGIRTGSITITTALKADLHIEVPSIALVADCTATPVPLILSGEYSYVVATDTMTADIEDPDFEIPEVETTTTCAPPVPDNVNGSLAGPGHKLSMSITAPFGPPNGGINTTTTTLAVDPAGSSAQFGEVELTATVADVPGQDLPDPAEVPTGTIRFRDGTTVLADVPLEGGVATLTTTALGLGNHSLTAQYFGDSIYKGSTSAAAAHTVSASPTVTANPPATATVAAAPKEFDVTTENPTVGVAVNNARVDVTIARYSDLNFSGDPLSPDRVKLEVEGPADVWTEIPFTQTQVSPIPVLQASLWPNTGFPLAPGESITDHVRLSFPDATLFTPPQGPTVPGPLDITFDVFKVDPGTGAKISEDPLSSTTGRIDLFRPGRIESTVVFANLFDEEFSPSVIRQHGTVGIPGVNVLPPLGNFVASGTFKAVIDGTSVPLYGAYPGDLTQPSGLTVPVRPTDGGQTLMVNLPPNVAPGPHTLTIAYSGDQQFLPSSKSVQITVIAPISDRPYTCNMDVFGDPRRFNIQLKTFGRTPASVTSGTTVSLDDFDFEIVADRTIAAYYPFYFTIGIYAQFDELILDMGPEGTGSATGATLDPEADYTGGPAYADDPDINVAFTGEEASFTVTGEPGEVVTPSIEHITLKGIISEIPLQLDCAPAYEDQPFEFGPITVAGTTLDVQGVPAPGPTRANDDVTLTASVFPSTGSGTVRFYDGTTLLDIAAVNNGQAVTTVKLPEGEHSLTAKFFAGASAPSTTSAAVPFTVAAAIECDDFADEGNGAAVRLVYLELLERCPDQDGYDYWTTALDDEDVTREQFARRISISLEARKVVVNDAYQLMLERDASPADRDFWARRLATGRYDTLLADLASSLEFRTLAGGTNQGFIERVYEQILNREADPDGVSYWMFQLNRGVNRRQLVLTLANLTEPLSVVVKAAYQDLLCEAPTEAQLAAGIRLLRSRSNHGELYASIIGQDAFFDLAQTFPNPEDC